AEGEFTVAGPLVTGSSHTATVIYADTDGVKQTNGWNFKVGAFKSGAGTLFIEAEDFNYSDDGVNGGLHANFGDPDCSLMGKQAIEGVDYHGIGDNAGQVYRSPTTVAAGKLNEPGESERGDHTLTCNYIVGWNDAGEWRNYTRDFGASRFYNVYARMASGDAT